MSTITVTMTLVTVQGTNITVMMHTDLEHLSLEVETEAGVETEEPEVETGEAGVEIEEARVETEEVGVEIEEAGVETGEVGVETGEASPGGTKAAKSPE